MRAGKFDIIIQRGNYGEPSRRTFIVKDRLGRPITLTDAVVTFRTSIRSVNIGKSSATGTVTIDDTLSTISLIFTKEEVASIPDGINTKYSIDIAFPDGGAVRVLEGNLVGEGVR